MKLEELYAARRNALEKVVNAYTQKKGGTRAQFMAQAKQNPTLLSRWLKHPDEKHHKAIGEEVALSLEAAHDLEPGLLLFPAELRTTEFTVADPEDGSAVSTAHDRSNVVAMGGASLTAAITSLRKLTAALPADKRQVVAKRLADYLTEDDEDELLATSVCTMLKPTESSKQLHG